MFYTYEKVLCPNCLKNRIKSDLICVENNYSGCCVDIGECIECEKVYEISYKVDKINEINVDY